MMLLKSVSVYLVAECSPTSTSFKATWVKI